MIHLSAFRLLLFVISFGLLNNHVARSMADRMWSEWTQWSVCSRSCGGGAKMRTRVCKMSGYWGGAVTRTCPGENVEYELCSMQNCPAGAKEFLEYQCSLRDGQRGVEWIPYPYGPNPCELQCWSKDRRLVRSFGKAVDGTKCTNPDQPGEPALCINGRCTGVDCAGQIGRDNRRDRCGVCRGNNATCVHRSYASEGRPRTSEGLLHYEYDRIGTIPSGATDISVREDSRTNFLALSDANGEYGLNGEWRVQSPGWIRIRGTDFSYERSREGVESLRARGPTRFETHLYVLGSGDVPPVLIDYWISSDHDHRRQSSPQLTSNRTKDLEFHRAGTAMKFDAFRFQGYRSYYHRNEILRSVPSWSRKRQGARRQQRVDRHRATDVQSDVASTTTDGRRVLGADAGDGRREAEDARQIQMKHRSRSGMGQKVVSVTAISVDGSGGRLKEKDRYAVDKKRRNPSKKKRKSGNDKKRRNPSKKKRKSGNDDCQPCPKPKQPKKSFCTSDFVLRAMMLSAQEVENSLRYELQIVQSYKNNLPISPREYVWTPGAPCRCPRLRTDREYILMGHSGTSGRESRLVLRADSFVRRYTPKRAKTLQRLVRDQDRMCEKF